MKEIKKVCVAGAGLMGRQIALNTALHGGYDVTLTDSVPEALAAAGAWAEEYLAGRIAKGKLTADQVADANARLHLIGALEEAADGADLVIEAIIEDQKIKEAFFTQLNGIVSKEAIIATNSSFMVSSIFAHCVDNPARLANIHYFNPALVMKLTEIVKGPHTSQETADALMSFSRSTAKDPVLVTKEIDGFIANRIVRVVKHEALYILEQGVATAADIDTAVEKGLNYPMGPFKLMDLTGIDLSYLAAKRVLEETGVKQAGYDLLKQKYEAHEWGRKTGKGWYDYSK